MTVSEAQAEMSAIGARLARAYPETNAGVSLTVRPLLDKVVSGVRPTLLALLAMVTFVLLIACANVANTLLARASGRQKEIALRIAIGASRARVIRQLLTESMLLAAAGAIAGLALAILGIQWLLGVLPPGSLPRQQDVSFDLRVFMASANTVVAGIGRRSGRHCSSEAVVSRASGWRRGPRGNGRTRVAHAVAADTLGGLLAGAGLIGRTMLNGVG